MCLHSAYRAADYINYQEPEVLRTFSDQKHGVTLSGLMEMVTVYGESARRFWMRGRFMSRSWTK